MQTIYFPKEGECCSKCEVHSVKHLVCAMRLNSVHMFSADCISALDWQTCASAEWEQSRAGPWEWALHWHLLPLSVF